MLGGSGSIAAWASGTDYVQGELVSFGGHYYVALVDLTASAVDPESDAASANPSWALSDDNYQVRQQAASIGAQSSVTGASPGGSVASAPFTQPAPPSGTSATIYGSAHAGGDVQVRATDRLDLTSLAGVAAVGLGALGAGIAIITVGLVDRRRASPPPARSARAGPSVSTPCSSERVDGLAAAGGVGGIAISGQVVVITDSSSQTAHIDTGATVPRAVTKIAVDTVATRTVSARTFGVSIAAGAVGAAIAVATISGDTTALVGNVTIGAGGAVGGLVVSAVDTIIPTNQAVSVQGGVGAALSGAVAVITYSGSTRAASGAHGSVTIGGLGVSVTATGNHTGIRADTLNISVSAGVSAGLTLAWATNARSTDAALTSTSDVTTSGAVAVVATAWNEARADAPGGSGGAVSVVIVLPQATISGHTRAQLDGQADGSSVTVRAAATNTASATTVLVSLSVIGGGAGAYAHSVITRDADTSACVGAFSATGVCTASAADITSSGGAVTVQAGRPDTTSTGAALASTDLACTSSGVNTITNHGTNCASSVASGGAGGVLAAATVFVSDASVDAGVHATLTGIVRSVLAHRRHLDRVDLGDGEDGGRLGRGLRRPCRLGLAREHRPDRRHHGGRRGHLGHLRGHRHGRGRRHQHRDLDRGSRLGLGRPRHRRHGADRDRGRSRHRQLHR